MGNYGFESAVAPSIKSCSTTEALNWLANEVSELALVAEQLQVRLAPVTRRTAPGEGKVEARPAYACDLAEEIAAKANQIQVQRYRLIQQLDTLELP